MSSFRQSVDTSRLFVGDLAKLETLLNVIGTKTVIPAQNRALNRIKRSLSSKAVPIAARTANLSNYHIKRKVPAKFQHNATPKVPRAKITLRRTDMAAISLFARASNSRKGASNTYRKGDLDKAAIEKAMLRSRKSKQKTLKVGKGKTARTYRGAFIAQGKRRASDPKYNDYVQKKYGAGRNVLAGKYFHVLKRVGPKPYPLDVISIPIKKPLTNAFRAASRIVFRRGGQAQKEFTSSYKFEILKYTGALRK